MRLNHAVPFNQSPQRPGNAPALLSGDVVASHERQRRRLGLIRLLVPLSTPLARVVALSQRN